MWNCKTGILAALALALGTCSAMAEPDFFVSGGIGVHNRSFDDVSRSYPLINGRITAEKALTPVLNAQGDITFGYRRFDDGTSSHQVTNLEGAMHVFYRDPEKFLLGGFVQYGNQWETFEGIGTFNVNFTRLYGGVEGQIYFDNLTLYGQLGVSRRVHEDTIAYAGPFATAELRYFLTPDFKVDLHGSAFKGELDASFSYTTLGVGVGAEYRLPESPVSLFGSLDHYVNNYNDSNGTTETRLMAGLKFNFGTDTLLDRDRNGASLNPIAHVPFLDLLP